MTETKFEAKRKKDKYGNAWNDFNVAVADEEGFAFLHGDTWLYIEKEAFLKEIAYISYQDYANCPDGFYFDVQDAIEDGDRLIIGYGGEFDWVIAIKPGESPRQVARSYDDDGPMGE